MSIGDVRDRLLPESRYIGPTEVCPRPERWHSRPDGQSTEIEVSELIGGLVRGLQPDTVVETGSYSGQTTEIILRALDENEHGTLVTCEVDVERRHRSSPSIRAWSSSVTLSRPICRSSRRSISRSSTQTPEIRVQEFELLAVDAARLDRGLP